MKQNNKERIEEDFMTLKEEDICSRCKKNKAILIYTDSNLSFCEECYNKQMRKSNWYKQGYQEAKKDFIEIIDEVENPYPEDIFLPVSKGEYTAIHNLLLKHFNIPLDRVSADLMRTARFILIEEIKQELKKRIEQK